MYTLSPLLLMFQIPRTQPGTLQVFNKYLLNKIRILAMLFSLWGELFPSSSSRFLANSYLSF